ncbi:MAG: hypothetical protein N3I35_13445 [Clostridia bacterium]|nr:hypothetical protein [Clostridia bacterium]
MRVKRVEKFRRTRHRRKRNFFFLAFILPCTLVFIGYIISSFFILPVMAGK